MLGHAEQRVRRSLQSLNRTYSAARAISHTVACIGVVGDLTSFVFDEDIHVSGADIYAHSAARKLLFVHANTI